MCLHRAQRKVRQIAANRALTGRKTNMIKVLFICHGRDIAGTVDSTTMGLVWHEDTPV